MSVRCQRAPLPRVIPALWFALVLACVWLSPRGWARGQSNRINEYVHNSWRTEDGLPQNSVLAILQTRDGYLWLGTQEGLVRFNGNQFTVFSKGNTRAFKHNDIRALLQDRQGTLWIGSFGGGLIEYHDGEFRSYQVENGLSSNTVGALFQDRSGNLWVGTNDGLDEFKEGKFLRFGKEQGLSDSSVNALVQDRNGNLWIGTDNGLNRDSSADLSPANITKLLPGQVIKTLAVGANGDVWVGTQAQGIYRFPAEQGPSTQPLKSSIHYGLRQGLPQASLRALLEDDGDLWAATDGGGLCRLIEDKADATFECYTAQDGLTGNSVASLFKDREGSLWVGTATGGLNQFRQGVVSMFAPGTNPDDASRAIYEGRDGSLWIAMDSGLRRYQNGKLRLYRTNKGPANNDTWSVIEDKNGNIWVGTKGGGVNEFTNHGVKTYTTADGLADNQVYALFQDHTGDIWVGTPNGLSRFHNGKFITYTRKNGMSGQHVWYILEDHAHNLWVGHDAGLTLYRDGKFSNYDFGAPGAWLGGVTYIYEDRDHVLWFGTDASGLKRLKDGKFTTFGIQDGMFDETVWAALEDDQGNFWISSNRGIFRVKKSDLNDFADGRISHINSVAYGISDGIPGSECDGESESAAWKLHDGRLLFACVRGVVAVNPLHLDYNPLPPPVVLETALANKQPIASEARIPVGMGQLEFHFAGLSYVSPDKVRIKYKLEGYDSDWIDAEKRHEAFYTNIPPGEYTFHVIVSNNDGVWNNTGAVLHLYLLPRFYKTRWFYALCALLVLGAGAAAYLWRIRRSRKREQDLIVLVNERTRELQQEVAQRKEAEEALRRTAEIVETSSDAIWSIDAAGKIATWNSGAEKLFGYTSAEAVGQSAHLVVPPERAWELDFYLTLMLNGEEVTNLETVRRSKNGDLIDVSLSRSPMYKDGAVVSVSVIALDIRERKRAEEALQRAKEAAEAATHAKSEFLANMSHEIRTPLNGMIGMVEQARQTELTPEQAELLKMARDSANTLLVVVNDILDFSRIEAGKLAFDCAEFDFLEVVAGTLRNLAPRAREKGLELRSYMSAGLPPSVSGDAVRLGQVLSNLVGNAIKFTETGTVTVRASAGKNIGDEAEILFSVSDTGIGIPANKKNSIFEAFSQADASTTRKFGGTGLGLAICSRIVDLMGGRIWVESELGKGSTFYFTARLKVMVHHGNGKREDGNGAYRSQATESFRILVAEDNPVNQKLAVRILEKAGHRVSVAGSGKEALDKLKQESFDLVLMDLQMPEMDGFAATEAIRRGERMSGHHLPIIAMTAHAMKGDRERCLEIGMDEYISKPIDLNALLELIARVMREHHSRQAAYLHTPN